MQISKNRTRDFCRPRLVNIIYARLAHIYEHLPSRMLKAFFLNAGLSLYWWNWKIGSKK